MLNNMLLGGYLGAGNAMQGAMNQMTSLNTANQQASLANKALGARGGGGQPQQFGVGQEIPSRGQFNQYLQYQQEQADNDRAIRQKNDDYEFGLRQRQNTDRDYNANNNRAWGFLGSMFGPQQGQSGGQQPQWGLPTQFNTNYGAHGAWSTPAWS